jgi:hypothetical protein
MHHSPQTTAGMVAWSGDPAAAAAAINKVGSSALDVLQLKQRILQ